MKFLLVAVAAVLPRNQELLLEGGSQLGDERERFRLKSWPMLFFF